jgi:hypothetical protein
VRSSLIGGQRCGVEGAGREKEGPEGMGLRKRTIAIVTYPMYGRNLEGYAIGDGVRRVSRGIAPQK